MVVLGVDPHKQTYTVVAVDQTGRKLAQLTVSARTDGQLRLLGWARQLPLGQGGERRWAVEDGRQVGGRLVAELLRAGEQVVWVPPKLMANARTSARTRGKSDPIDALAVARAALREPGLAAAHPQGPGLAVRLVADHREDLVAERTRMLNRLRWHLHDLDPELAPPTGTLTRLWVLDRLAGQLQGLAGVRAEIAAELVVRIRQLTERINQLQADLDRRVEPLSGQLRQVVGVGRWGGQAQRGDRWGGPLPWQRPVRHARRRGPDPGLVRQPDPAPAQPRWQPAAECGHSPGGGHPASCPSTGPGADGPPDRCRQQQTRGLAGPQTPPRRHPLRCHVLRRKGGKAHYTWKTSRGLT